MAPSKKAKKDAQESPAIYVEPVERQILRTWIIGLSPLICNRLSEKAKRQLLLPPLKTNRAQRVGSLKHDPMEEFRSSPYKLSASKLNLNPPTLIGMPAACLRKAIAAAAIDVPGSSNRSQVGRLCYVVGDLLPVYGVPKMLLAPVRSAGMNRAPDIRTRAILEQWVMGPCDISFIHPLLTAKAVSTLANAAGSYLGIGDWRGEKGSGNYGLFTLAPELGQEAKEIVAGGGRAVQEAAMAAPQFYDDDSEELFGWFVAELADRGKRAPEELVADDGGEEQEAEAEVM